MSIHADKTQENKSQSMAIVASPKQRGGESTFKFVDNRPEAVAQRKLQEMANNSPQMMRLRTFQDMANNSPQVKQAAQWQAMADNYSAQQQLPVQKKENSAGLPDNLKIGMENLSGISLDDVKVHRNSDKPAQLQAHAYTQGTDIHLAPGQEKYLPHEAWHVVQQKQGRVQATTQLKGDVPVNDDVSLEAEADEMGLQALQKNTDDNIVKRVNTGGLLAFNGVTQLVKIITAPQYVAPEGITYEFEDIFEMDLTSILAGTIAEDDPSLETFELILKGARAKYFAIPNARAVADIDEVLVHLANPQDTGFATADAGHRITGATDYASIRSTVMGILESRADYDEQIRVYANKYATQKTLDGYTKLREYVGPFVQLPARVLLDNGGVAGEVFNLFHYLMPLHDEAVKAIDNKQSLMARIKIALTEKIGFLNAMAHGVAELPRDSLIRYGGTRTIADNALGTRSEIKTAFLGALRSGEKATPRDLETRLTEHYSSRFVAGHLVADSLGGKNVAQNLTPMTNAFNTSGGINGIKDPENEALKRLKAGKVIFYRTRVNYANAASGNWYTAVLPTSVEVRLANLNLQEDGDAQDIDDYKHTSDELVYTLTMGQI